MEDVFARLVISGELDSRFLATKFGVHAISLAYNLGEHSNTIKIGRIRASGT